MTAGLKGVDLPSAWRWSQLRHVTLVLRRGTAPDYVDDGPVRVISQAANQANGLDWSKTRFHNFAGDPRSLKGYLKPEDVIINSTGTGTLGRVGFYTDSIDNKSCAADGHLTVVRVLDGQLHPRFGLHYLSSSPFQHFIMSALVVGSTNQIELSAERLSSAPIALPPLEEQRRIADFLDAETIRIDRLSSLRSRWVEALRTRWVSAFECELLRASSIEVALWRLLIQPPQYGAQEPGDSGEVSWPRYIRITDLTERGELREDDIKRLQPELAKPYILKDGDILLARSGATVGKGCRYRSSMGPACFAGYLIRVRLDLSRADPEYVQLWLQASHYWCQIIGSMVQSTIQNVNAERYSSLRVPLPALDEQYRIVKRATEEKAYVDSVESRAARQIALLSERRQALIAAAVTGQIDVSTARGVEW